MDFQVLMISCDHLVTKTTLLTWTKYVDRIVVYANGPNKHLLKDSLKDIKNCCVILGDFEGFTNTRNKLIEMTKGYYYNIMIDDSYELRGNICELKNHTENHGFVRVNNNNEWQNRRIVFKTGKYSGHIHETLIPDSPTFQTQFFYIEDVVYKHHLIRTYKRMPYDLLMLDNEPDTPRTKYYRAGILARQNKTEEALVLFNELLTTEYSKWSEKLIKLISQTQNLNY